jgi:hypothetical protein
MASYEDEQAKLQKTNPIASAWIDQIIRRAGTSDADWSVLLAAGELLAEVEDRGTKLASRIIHERYK